MKTKTHTKPRRHEKEGGHSCPPTSGLEKLAAVGDGVQTELGCLPADWRVDRFDSVFSVQQGRQVSKGNRIGDNQRPFLRTKNIFWNRLDLADLDEMHFSEADESRLALKPDDLLICEGGDIGRTAIWRGAISRCYYQNHLHRARIRNREAANAQFVLFWLWYAFEFGHLYFGRGNVTTIPNLSQSKLCELPVVIPPPAEQRKIAGVLGLVQRAIEQQERLIALTTELKKALLHQLFTQGLRGEPQKQTEIGPVPENWDVVRLGNYCSLQGGFAFKSDDYVPAESGIPIIKIGDLQDGEVTLSQRSSFVPTSFWDQKSVRGFQLKRGDLLIALTGATTGKTAEFQLDGQAFLNQRVGRFLPNERSLKPAFLKHLVPQTYFQREIQQNILAAAQGNISPKRIEQFLVGVPSPDEQEQIGNILRTLDAKISVTRCKHAALTALFRTLLHQLMTAQIHVHGLDLSFLMQEAVSQ